MEKLLLDTDQKALEINLNPKIYGTFAEIGAGQEVARHFFKVGAAAGTIAKTMSAYDKTFSDRIYGIEETGRYVCESRLYKMLDHEYELVQERLQDVRPDTNFFVFADTVAAINFSKTVKGHGWLGVRFQLSPDGRFNEMILHVKMLDLDNQLQQQAIGILGVNMLYACYFYKNDYEKMVRSLEDGLRGRVCVDLIRLMGPDFKDADNRLLSLMLVENGLTDVAIFNESGQSVHASEFLYKKSLMVVRGNYRPPTKTSVDVFRSGYEQFLAEENLNKSDARLVAEMTLENLRIDGKIDHEDFIERANLLSSIGMTVVISNCRNHQKLINYLSDFKIKKLGLVIGVKQLQDLIHEKYEKNKDGRLLVAFGELFNRNIKVYIYPALADDGSGQVLNSENLPVPDGIKFLYRHLLDSEQVVDIKGYDEKLLKIFPWKVIEMIVNGEAGWKEMLPEDVAGLIEEGDYFSSQTKKIEYEY